MKKRAILVASLLSLVGVGAVLAQTVEGLDIGALQRRAAEHDADAIRLAAEVQRRGDAFREDAAAVEVAATANLRRAAAADLPGGPAGQINFDEMVKGIGTGTESGQAPQFIVFASLSMPPESLRPLIADTSRAGGVVVFQGFPNNSMKTFTTMLDKAINAKANYKSIGIDPRLFRAFNVTAVPAYVAVSSDFDNCDGFNCTTAVPPYDVMTGNVTVKYALSTFVEGRGPGAAVAATALKSLTAAP